MVPTFQYPVIEASRLFFQPILYAALVCSSLCQNVVLQPFHTRKETKITGSQVWADDGGWSNTSHRKRFRSLFVAAAVCGWALSWRRTIPVDNIPRSFFWIKESNYSMHSAFGGRFYCFKHVYGLTTRSELTNAMWRDRRAYCKHCPTHLRKASSDSHCGFNFAIDRTFKKIPSCLFSLMFMSYVTNLNTLSIIYVPFKSFIINFRHHS